jgi:hypothetical protein
MKEVITMPSLKKIVLATLVLVLVYCGASPQVSADTLNITGSFSLSPTGVDFLPIGTGVGTFTVGDPLTQSGIFVPLAGTAGTARDLDFLGGNPLNSPFGYPNFLTFAAAPNLSLELNFISLGVFSQAQCGDAPAAGQSCTPSFQSLIGPENPAGLSAFNLSNGTANSSTLSFDVRGIVVNTATGESTNFTGTFSSQFTSNFQTLLATWAGPPSGTVTSTYSATFVTHQSTNPVPEPTTMLLLGAGLAGVSAALRKRNRA